MDDKQNKILQREVIGILEKATAPMLFAHIWDKTSEDSIDVHVALERLFRAGKVDRLDHVQPTSDGARVDEYWVLKKHGRNLRAWKFE